MSIKIPTDPQQPAGESRTPLPIPDLPRRTAVVRSAFRVLLVIASIIVLLLAAVSYLGRYSLLAELISNFRLQIVLMLIVTSVATRAFGYRRWAGLLLLSGLILGAGFVRDMLPGPNPPAGPRTITLLSFNVYEGNEEYSPTIDCIRDADADVVFILEYDGDWSRELKALDARYPHQILEPRWHGFGIAVFSRLPLSDSHVYQLTENVTDNPLIMTHVRIGDQKLRLVATHLLAPMDRHRMEIRNNQLSEIAQLLSDRSVPTVVAGDFNCVPWSPFMKDMLSTSGLRDSRRGFGYQASWPTEWYPMRIPIDHALVSDSIAVSDRRILGPAGSDHFPLRLRFSITP